MIESTYGSNKAQILTACNNLEKNGLQENIKDKVALSLIEWDYILIPNINVFYSISSALNDP